MKKYFTYLMMALAIIVMQSCVSGDVPDPSYPLGDFDHEVTRQARFQTFLHVGE